MGVGIYPVGAAGHDRKAALRQRVGKVAGDGRPVAGAVPGPHQGHTPGNVRELLLQAAPPQADRLLDPRSASCAGHRSSEGTSSRPPRRAMVARSRSGARSGILGAQRFRAAPIPAQLVPAPLSARSAVISCSSAGPAFSWPVAIRSASVAPAALTRARPAASCGSISLDNAARHIRSLSMCVVPYAAAEAACRRPRACPMSLGSGLSRCARSARVQASRNTRS